jgi:FlaA1/EpsC-like NDP-sugar epimerase
MKKHITGLSQVVLAKRLWLISVFQGFLILCSLALAWLLRFDFTVPDRKLLLSSAALLILVRLGTLRLFNLHRGWWSFSGVAEATDILKAVGLGTIIFWLLLLGVRLSPFPRSICIMEAVLTASMLAGGRLFSRVLAASIQQKSELSRRVMLIGAGSAAQMVIRAIGHSADGLAVLGCVDDDRSKIGIKIHGVPVLGGTDDLPNLLQKHLVDEVLIAVPSATGEQMQQFIQVCQKANVKFRTVPSLRDIISGQASIDQFREVRLEDLLGREPVEMDFEAVRRELRGRVILVTGAAGSIGSELCRQIRNVRPEHLICLDQSETGIFYLQKELRSGSGDASATFCVADVNDPERIRALFKEFHPTVVFHAAAYKHVPVMERNVHGAVKNNVFGLLSLLEIADDSGCQSFVLISSDKAVNPTSVMGATKRIGELILSCRSANSMRCVSVRFGNVLGSSGSVVPVLEKQLHDNQPLTITHPDIKRFFMTTREAVSLVLQAFAIGDHGEILVLDMGEPISILELARTLIQLSGKTEDQVPICFTGLREGEKLYEELLFPTEAVFPTSCQKIKRIRGGSIDWPGLAQHLKELRASMNVNGAAPIRIKLREIVPEYAGRNEDAFWTRADAPVAYLEKAAGHY